jgi:hypothetical protein
MKPSNRPVGRLTKTVLPAQGAERQVQKKVTDSLIRTPTDDSHSHLLHLPQMGADAVIICAASEPHPKSFGRCRSVSCSPPLSSHSLCGS